MYKFEFCTLYKKHVHSFLRAEPITHPRLLVVAAFKIRIHNPALVLALAYHWHDVPDGTREASGGPLSHAVHHRVM
jgi:hypothetical protein